jgi:hypothetical protein
VTGCASGEGQRMAHERLRTLLLAVAVVLVFGVAVVVGMMFHANVTNDIYL